MSADSSVYENDGCTYKKDYAREFWCDPDGACDTKLVGFPGVPVPCPKCGKEYELKTVDWSRATFYG